MNEDAPEVVNLDTSEEDENDEGEQRDHPPEITIRITSDEVVELEH